MSKDEKIIKLDKKDVLEKINGNFGGGVGQYGWAYYLVVGTDGSHRIAGCERQTWSNDDYVAKLPAPFGDGSSEFEELAEDFLRYNGLLDQVDEDEGEGFAGCIERLGKDDEFKHWIDEALDGYAETWLSSLNGMPEDPSESAFGFDYQDPQGPEPIECPFFFEWA